MPPPARPIYISVVIPAYNEADRLGITVQEVRDHLSAREVGFEILLVNDGSTDGTAMLMTKLEGLMSEVRVFDLRRNHGKGRAVREGVLASRGEIVLITDADLSIEELPKLERALEAGADVASGSRFAAGARIEQPQPPHRAFMGRVFSAVVRLLLLRGMRDTQCGFKLLRGDVARAVFAGLRIDRFAYDVELLHRCRTQGVGVAEVPVRWLHSGRSSVVPVRDSAEMLRDVVMLRLRFSAGGRTARLR